MISFTAIVVLPFLSRVVFTGVISVTTIVAFDVVFGLRFGFSGVDD
jgi:hypothetical protein